MTAARHRLEFSPPQPGKLRKLDRAAADWDGSRRTPCPGTGYQRPEVGGGNRDAGPARRT